MPDSPTQSDKTVEEILDRLLKTVHPIIGDGQVEWPITAENEAIAALTAREKRMVQEAVRQRLTEYRGQPLSFYQAMQRDYGDET